jgi:hypothetical protein
MGKFGDFEQYRGNKIRANTPNVHYPSVAVNHSISELVAIRAVYIPLQVYSRHIRAVFGVLILSRGKMSTIKIWTISFF